MWDVKRRYSVTGLVWVFFGMSFALSAQAESCPKVVSLSQVQGWVGSTFDVSLDAKLPSGSGFYFSSALKSKLAASRINATSYRLTVPKDATGGTVTLKCGKISSVSSQSFGVVPLPKARCEIALSPVSLIAGESSILTLTTDPSATKVALTPSVSLAKSVVNGLWIYKATVKPTATTNYQASITNKSGVATCSAKLEVLPVPKPTCAFTVTPSEISAPMTVTFNLKTDVRATMVRVTPLLALAKSVQGSEVNYRATAAVTQATTYTAKLTGTAGTTTCQATVNFPKPKAPSCSVTATPAVLDYVQASQSILKIKTDSATNRVSVSPEATVRAGAAEGGVAVFLATVDPIEDTNYQISISGPGGSTRHSTSSL